MPFKISKARQYAYDGMAYPCDSIYLNYEAQHVESRCELFEKASYVLGAFGVLSLLTAWYFSFSGPTILKASFPPIATENGYEIGPIDVQKANHTYRIDVSANLGRQSWSFIEAELLDSQKNYLFSFADEISYYSGYEDGEYWTEHDSHFDMKISFPKVGKYFLKFSSQSNIPPSHIEVKVRRQKGSTIPHLIFGILCLIPACTLYTLRYDL